MRNRPQKIFIAFLFIVDTVLLLLALNNHDVLVNVKYDLFTNYTEDRKFFNGTPDDLKRAGFKIDSPENIRRWENHHAAGHTLLKEITADLSDVEKAKKIVLLFSKDSGNLCSNEKRMVDRFQGLSKGDYGCCVDYSEEFLALSSRVGLFSREVHTVVHVTDEFFSPERNQWIWIDPQHTLMAKDADGRYLSLTELRDAYFRGAKIGFDFFGTPKHFLYQKDPYRFEYYDSEEDFSDIMITQGNNVFAEDQFHTSLESLPKSAIQLIALSTGKQPSFLMYVDEHSAKAHSIFYKYFLMLTFVFILAGNVLVAGLLLKAGIQRMRRS